MKIVITKLDKLASEYVRRKAKGKCERCGRDYGDWKRLQCCHYHGRRMRNVRFDPTNLVALCFGCHQHFHEQPHEFDEFMLKRLGQAEFDNLNIRAHTIGGKVDYKLWELYLLEQLKSA